MKIYNTDAVDKIYKVTYKIDEWDDGWTHGGIYATDLARDCSAIPPQFTTAIMEVYIGSYLWTEGYYLTTKELTCAFKSIPKHIDTLDISSINIFRDGISKALDSIMTIPSHVKVLDMSDCGISTFSYYALIKFLPPILAKFSKIDISDNELRKECDLKVARVFSSITHNDTELDFSDCLLNQKIGVELITMFTSIPLQFDTLNLCHNHLWTKCADELISIFASIPTHITKLNISRNNFGFIKQADLVAVLQAIPSHVMTVDVSDNQLFTAKNLTHRDQLLDALKISTPNKWREIIAHKNGEAAFVRALLPLLSACKQELLISDIMYPILAYLLPAPVDLIKKKIEASLPISIIRNCYMQYESGIMGYCRSQMLFYKYGSSLLDELKVRARREPNGAADKTLDHFFLKM